MAAQTRLPTGDGTVAQHTAVGAANRWDCVNDPIGTPDDDTTYVSVTANNRTSLFTFSAFAITASAISRVSVYYRAKYVPGDGTASRAQVNVNGTGFDSGFVLDATSYTTVQADYLTHPATGLAWTESDVEGTGANPIIGFGFRNQNTGSGESWRCTQCYIEVSYTDAGGGTAFPHHYYQQMRGL